MTMRGRHRKEVRKEAMLDGAGGPTRVVAPLRHAGGRAREDAAHRRAVSAGISFDDSIRDL